LLNGSNALEHAVQLAAIVQGHDSTHWTIIATTDKLSANPNRWNRSSAKHIAHFGANGLTLGILIQFHHFVSGPLLVQELLGLDTEGSGGEAQHQNRVVFNETIHPSADGSCIVIASQTLDESLLSLVEETHQMNLGRRISNSGGEGRFIHE
jgi:hypothetical protein